MNNEQIVSENDLNFKELKRKLSDALAKGIAYRFDGKKKEDRWSYAEIGKYGASSLDIVNDYLLPIIKPALNDARTSGLPSKSRDEAIVEFEKNRRRIYKEHTGKDVPTVRDGWWEDSAEKAAINLYEAARQSGKEEGLGFLKIKEDLKKQCKGYSEKAYNEVSLNLLKNSNSTLAEISELKKQLAEKDKELVELKKKVSK